MSERKLAAILFADIVGYTAMMQSDEGNAVSRLNHYQEVLKKAVREHRGEIIKNYGDGSLCLFTSVLDAVHCAKVVQEELRKEPKVPLRIGLHMGDVMYRENDVYGDALNISSRIESMSVPGSVMMSKDIHKKVKNQADLQFENLGSFEFKNVEEPMEIFALANEGFPVPKREELFGKFKTQEIPNGKSGLQTWWPLIAILFVASALFFIVNKRNTIPKDQTGLNEKSIAVLPFTDMSQNRDQEYFADGVMEEILNHLVKIEGLEVTSRTSSMTYKGQDKRASEIASELGVASILEGSVRKAGDALRITVQFIDGTTDKHIWSESYDGNFDNVFDMQSDIAIKVANQLRAQIEPEVVERIEKIPTKNMEAYALYLKGNQIFGAEESNKLLMEAISLDSSFSQAYSALGRNKLYEIIFTRSIVPEDFEEYLNEVHELLDKALEFDPNNSDAYIHKGAIRVWFEWDFEGAVEFYKKAISLNPATSYIAYTELLLAKGEFEEAENSSYRNLSANENNTLALLQHGMVNFFQGNNQKAFEVLEIIKERKSISTDGNYLRLLTFLGSYKKMLSNYETIPREGLYPRAMGYAAISYYHTDQQEKVDSILIHLKQQSEESSIGSPAFHLALVYSQMGDNDQAFHWLEKAYEDREVEMYWLKVEPPFKPLYDDPRWEEMLFKVGFDLPVKG